MNVFGKQKFKTGGVLLATASLLGAPAAYAELEEVIVTATKRAESLQDVPVSVSAMNSEMMEAAGVTDIAEVAAYIPNFEVSDASILPNLYVRGIGSGTTHSIEQSVGRFIDEVYIGRAAINLHGFMDVASVEVLRGPQGTLFGKNTLGGAMIIHTADPTEEVSVGIKSSISEYSTTGGNLTIEGHVSGALSDTVRGRLALQYKDKDGYIENQLPGPDGGTREDWGVRAKLAWDAGDNTLVNLKLEHMEYQEEGQTPSETVSGTFPGGPAAGTPITEEFIQQFAPNFSFSKGWESEIDCTARLGPENSTFCPDRDQDSQNVTLKIDHEIAGVGTITAVSGFQQYDYVHNFVAIDQGIVGGSLRATRAETFDGFSQEIRLTSEEFDTYDYIVGVYYEDSNLKRDQFSDFNVPAFVGGGPLFTDREDWVQDTETVAVFGQVRYHVSETVSAILGGRWSSEDKDFHFEIAEVPYQDDPRPALDEVFDESRSESEFTPSFTLRWEASDDMMFFASVAEGHKTGGFSDRIQDPLEFDAELNTTFEVGMKGVWLDGALETNLAIFHMSIEDLQVARALPGLATGFEVRNAAEATSEGVEFDGRWQLNDNWTLGGNFAYTDATYDDFLGANTACPPVGGTLEEGLCNYAGLPLIYAPEWKGSIYLQFAQDDFANGWDISARAGVNYSDEYYPEINYLETLKQDSYSTVDASVRLTAPNERLSVALVGRNLTEEYVVAWGLQAGFAEYVAPNAPREIALKVAYNL